MRLMRFGRILICVYSTNKDSRLLVLLLGAREQAQEQEQAQMQEQEQERGSYCAS